MWRWGIYYTLPLQALSLTKEIKENTTVLAWMRIHGKMRIRFNYYLQFSLFRIFGNYYKTCVIHVQLKTY